MARLIEFFSRTGELVLDPFAGVGGTLIGAAIARGPRRALGIELDPRWAAVYERGRARPRRRARRAGSGRSPISARPIPGGVRASTRPALELRVGDALAVLPTLDGRSIDLVATDPPYNVQLPLTMAGGALAETHANRRTDYAMISDSTGRPGQRARLRRPSSTGWRRSSARWRASCATGPLCGGHRARRLPGRALRVHRRRTWPRGPRGRARARRAISSGTRPAPGCGRTAIRAPSSRTSPTSTSWCSARNAGGAGQSRRSRDSR